MRIAHEEKINLGSLGSIAQNQWDRADESYSLF